MIGLGALYWLNPCAGLPACLMSLITKSNAHVVFVSAGLIQVLRVTHKAMRLQHVSTYLEPICDPLMGWPHDHLHEFQGRRFRELGLNMYPHLQNLILSIHMPVPRPQLVAVPGTTNARRACCLSPFGCLLHCGMGEPCYQITPRLQWCSMRDMHTLLTAFVPGEKGFAMRSMQQDGCNLGLQS
jgi:hypothetical protein